MTENERKLIEAAEELLAAIERRWEGESQRKRDSVISPRQQEAMDALRDAIESAKQQ